MKRVRQLLAVLVGLLLVLETADVGATLARGALVHCCCGDHSIRHACGCRSCPSARAKKAVSDGNRIDSAKACGGESVDGRLVVLVPLEDPPSLSAPVALGRTAPLTLTALRSRTLDTSRPPP